MTRYWNRMFEKKSLAIAQSRRKPSSQRRFIPRLEFLSERILPSVFNFSTGHPDGKAATISEPPNAHNSGVEFESADDFALNAQTVINRASFTGLLTGGATTRDVSNIVLTIYRVFPNDSDVGRTSGPPTFSTAQVPTRVNSPADNEIENFDSTGRDLHFDARVLGTTFTTLNSVSSADKISNKSGGNGPATGEEVEFNVTFRTPLELPAGHYFFVPKVGLSDKAPAGADFLWLSAPRPIMPPGTPFPAGVTDLQSWMRFEPGLAPDWLRVGTDIIGGATFNASFSLSGHTVAPRITGLSQTSAPEGSADLTITVNGSNFTSLSTVLVNGVQPLSTRFVSSNQIQAIIPAALLAEEGHFKISVLDGENGRSKSVKFTVTDSDAVHKASVAQGQLFQEITLDGQLVDQAFEGTA
jgi:hypothetical protein